MATHEYGYNGKNQYADYLELDDNLNFAIEAIDEEYLRYYLIVYTKTGMTTSLEYGPLSQEDDIVPEESIIKYNQFEVDNKKVDDIISKFLGRKKRLPSHKSNPFDTRKLCNIVEVNQIPIELAIDQGINLFEFLKLIMKE